MDEKSDDDVSEESEVSSEPLEHTHAAVGETSESPHRISLEGATSEQPGTEPSNMTALQEKLSRKEVSFQKAEGKPSEVKTLEGRLSRKDDGSVQKPGRESLEAKALGEQLSKEQGSFKKESIRKSDTNIEKSKTSATEDDIRSSKKIREGNLSIIMARSASEDILRSIETSNEYSSTLIDVDLLPEMSETSDSIDYALLRNDSLFTESTDHMKGLHTVESIIERYRDYRKNIVSLESLETSGSISFESLEDEKFSIAETIEEEEQQVEEEEEEDEIRKSGREPSFLDEFDMLEDVALEEASASAQAPGMGVFGDALREQIMKEQKHLEEPIEKPEEPIEYDSEDEILSESEDDIFFNSDQKTEKLREQREDQKDKIDRKVEDLEVKSEKELSEDSTVTFNEMEITESRTSMEDSVHSLCKKWVEYGSDYEFKFQFYWHKRRKSIEDKTIENVNNIYAIKKGEDPFSLINEIDVKVQDIKLKMKEKEDEPKLSHISDVKINLESKEEPCLTRTEDYILNDIGPVLIDIASDVAKQNLFKNNCFKYAGHVFEYKAQRFEPTLSELDAASDLCEVRKLLQPLKISIYSSYLERQESLSEPLLYNLKSQFLGKKNDEIKAKERDELFVKLWMKQFPTRTDFLSKLANHDILYNPIPKRNLPKENQHKIAEIIKREKKLMKLRETEYAEQAKLRNA